MSCQSLVNVSGYVFTAMASQPAGGATATAAAMDIPQNRTYQPVSSALGRVDAPSRDHDKQQQPQQQSVAAIGAQQQQWDQGSALGLLMRQGNPAGGQRNSGGRSFLAVVPQMDQATADTLPLLGGSAGAQTPPEVAYGQQNDTKRGPRAPRVMRGIPAWLDAADSDNGSDASEASGPSGASPTEVRPPLHMKSLPSLAKLHMQPACSGIGANLSTPQVDCTLGQPSFWGKAVSALCVMEHHAMQGGATAQMGVAAKSQFPATMSPSGRSLPMPIEPSAQVLKGAKSVAE